MCPEGRTLEEREIAGMLARARAAAAERAQGGVKEDPWKQRVKLVAKLVRAKYPDLSGEEFERKFLEEMGRVGEELLLGPGREPGLTAKDVEELTARRLEQKIAEIEAERAASGSPSVEEGGPSTEALFSFDKKAFAEALMRQLPSGELAAVAKDLQAGLETNIKSVLFERAVGGQIRSVWPNLAEAIEKEGMEQWAMRKAQELSTALMGDSLVRDNGPRLVGALTVSGLDRELALKVVVYVATNIAKGWEPETFGIKGELNEPAEDVFLAIGQADVALGTAVGKVENLLGGWVRNIANVVLREEKPSEE